jgi:condensin complex subunit 3
MPARISTTRSARSSAVVSHKSSAQTLNSRASTASRISSPYAEIPAESPETALRVQICSILKDAQNSTASHRKLVINLRKIQEACCYEPTSRKKKTGVEEFDEEKFNQEITRCVLRAMPVKRSESVGERVIRFLGLFLKHANEKDNELVSADNDETELMIETPSTRLTAQVMSAVLPLLTSKDKVVRFRSTQLISHIVNSLDSMDDDLFQMLRHGLLKRIRDKEAMVRVQAVLGLGRLAGNEMDGASNSQDSDDDSGAGLLEKLLDVLQNDPSADVRRSLLVNLPILPNTLPFLLERARDQDPATRRALYSRLLPTLGDFRHLSLSMREKLLRWGLRDRDENVRKAASRLFRERWIEDCALTSSGDEGGPVGGNDLRPPNFDGLLELLERIDVVNSGVENGVAIEAMKGFWEGRPDYRDAVTFDDNFWDTLTAESVFMARSFNDFCRSEGNGKFEDLIEQKMPEVTKLAYYLQRYVNVLVDALKRIALQDLEAEEEEDAVEQEFIVEQLLHIAQTLDYSDEVGRRRMFALLRQSLAVPDLPEEVTKLIIEVLKGICAPDAAGEREFCSVILEAVADIHDTIMDEPQGEDADESFHSAKSEVSEDAPTKATKKSTTAGSQDEDREKAIREIMVNMKCLHVVQCMLQNVEGGLQQNPDLVATLNNLVVPAVRSHEAPVRERGLVCLGLCSLLDKVGS